MKQQTSKLSGSLQDNSISTKKMIAEDNFLLLTIAFCFSSGFLKILL